MNAVLLLPRFAHRHTCYYRLSGCSYSTKKVGTCTARIALVECLTTKLEQLTSIAVGGEPYLQFHMKTETWVFRTSNRALLVGLQARYMQYMQ